MEHSHIGREHTHAQGAMEARAKQIVSRRLLGAGPPMSAPAQPVPAQPTRMRGPDADLGSRATPQRHRTTEYRATQYPDTDEDFGFLDGRWTSNTW